MRVWQFVDGQYTAKAYAEETTARKDVKAESRKGTGMEAGDHRVRLHATDSAP